MTEIEKIEQLKHLLSPDSPSDEELTALLLITKGAILNRRYPLGSYYGEEVPPKYEYLQLQMCVQLYNKKGVEGQTSHSENGITRNYEVGDIPQSLLKQIIPCAGSVYHEES
jgi:hypothetical protein